MDVKYKILSRDTISNVTKVQVWLGEEEIFNGIGIICNSIFALESQLRELAQAYIEDKKLKNDLNDIINTERTFKL